MAIPTTIRAITMYMGSNGEDANNIKSYNLTILEKLLIGLTFFLMYINIVICLKELKMN